jgi:Pyridine nucleotide-disulphide oxidoreductase
MSAPQKSVAIIGAGPVGLAAAAHLLERSLHPVVLEAGELIGHAVRQWGHVRMFSPWSYNVDKAAERLLSEQGWNAPDPDQYPTGLELVERYLEPLARRTALKDRVRTKARVVSVARVGFDKVKTAGRDKTPSSGRGRERFEHRGLYSVRGTTRIDVACHFASHVHSYVRHRFPRLLTFTASSRPEPHAGAIFMIAINKTNARGFQREATPLLHRSLLRIAVL